jgi:hypothetical protein
MAPTGERVEQDFLDGVLEIQAPPTVKGDDAEQ